MINVGLFYFIFNCYCLIRIENQQLIYLIKNHCFLELKPGLFRPI